MDNFTPTHTHTHMKPISGVMGMGTSSVGYGYSWVPWVQKPSPISIVDLYTTVYYLPVVTQSQPSSSSSSDPSTSGSPYSRHQDIAMHGWISQREHYEHEIEQVFLC